jgi:hypothetical protein
LITILQSVTAVDEFEIKIKSFIVKNAMESVDSIQSRILSKIIRDLQNHLFLIASNLFGSLTVLGKPGTCIKNIKYYYLLLYCSGISKKHR